MQALYFVFCKLTLKSVFRIPIKYLVDLYVHHQYGSNNNKTATLT